MSSLLLGYPEPREERWYPRRLRSRLRSSALQSTNVDSPIPSEDQTVVDREVSEVDAELLRVIHRKCALLRKRNSLSLISCLPDECLSMIFVWSQELELCGVLPASQRSPPLYYSQDRIPTAVSQVCSRWRAVAFSSPRLWSKLSVTVGDYDRPPSMQDVYVEGLKERILKMKDVPFELHVRGFSPRVYRHSARDRGLSVGIDMDVLSTCIPRCRVLDLQLAEHESVSARHICRRFLIRMPFLETFSLTSQYDLPGQLIVPMPIPGRNLKQLSLRGVQVHHITKEALAGLEVFRLRRSSMLLHDDTIELDDKEIERMREEWREDTRLAYSRHAMPLDVIQAAANVRVLELRQVCVSVSSNFEGGSLPNLQDLELALGCLQDPVEDEDEGHLNGILSMVSFFQHTAMPALRTCKLLGSYCPYYDVHMDEVLDVLAGVAPPLTELTLETFSFTTAQKLLHLLSFLPRLESLSLIRTSLDKDAVDGLRADRPGLLVPKLRYLRISQSGPFAAAQAGSFKFLSIIAIRNVLRTRFESNEAATIDDFVLRDDHIRGTRDTQQQLEKWVRKVDLDIRRYYNRRFAPNHLFDSIYNDSPYDLVAPHHHHHPDIMEAMDAEYAESPPYAPTVWGYSPPLDDDDPYDGDPPVPIEPLDYEGPYDEHSAALIIANSPASPPEAGPSYDDHPESPYDSDGEFSHAINFSDVDFNSFAALPGGLGYYYAGSEDEVLGSL